MCCHLGRTWAAICKRATVLGVRRDVQLGRTAKKLAAKKGKDNGQVTDSDAIIEEDMPVIASDCAVSGYAHDTQEHIRAKKLAALHGKKAMEGTPVVVDSKTMVIKRKKNV
jgi:Mg-chelatase subunit ChlI